MKTETIFPSTLLCDFYKVAHKDQYPIGTEVIYSTLTPRSNRYFPSTDKVVVFGIQVFVKKYLINYFNTHFFSRKKEDVLNEYERVIKFTLGVKNPDSTHIAKLHDLGYLPIRLKALKEGSKANIKTPVLTIENTVDDFFWFTNYLETLLSSETWQAMTNATTAYKYRQLMDEYAFKTVGNNEAVGFQGHDFSFRGMTNLDAAAISAAAHLLAYYGTDTIPGILLHEKYYNANIEEELVGTSIPATEHSVMCAGTDADSRDEYEMFKRLITEVYPEGFVSIVSDSYDFWDIVRRVIPMLKKEILARNGKVVIRPDSGDPVEILLGQLKILSFHNHHEAEKYLIEELLKEAQDACGHKTKGHDVYESVYKLGNEHFLLKVYPHYTLSEDSLYNVNLSKLVSRVPYEPTLEDIGLIEALWNIFGGTISETGYKLLDEHIGAIYGDSITLERAEQILKGLEEKGFASTNVVLGIGSYTYTYNTRDTLGFAIKATYAKINGKEKLLFKDPKTDDGTKRSQRGRVIVYEENQEIVYQDGLNLEQEISLGKEKGNLLETVFENGKLMRDQSLSEIRELLNN